MKIYTKFYNRSLPLYAVQYWYKGEHPGIEKIIGMKYNSLFYYKNGKATDIYYEKNTTEEVSKRFVDYYKENPSRLDDAIMLYKKLHKDGLSALQKRDLIKVFDVAEKMWPVLATLMLLGEAESTDPETLKLKKIAIKTRSETDKFIYDIGNGVWDSIDPLISERAKSFLTVDEIISKKYPSWNEISKRELGYIYTKDALTTGLTLKDFARQNNFVIEDGEVVKDVNKFPGQVACKGKITGKVRIVLEFRDMFKFLEGEVLVSSMTVPDFLPAMKKAIAFVTDEGGITCHAAIIAREMKKPCIIGTKIATQVLKDGDLVEVDAERGVVKIIKKG